MRIIRAKPTMQLPKIVLSDLLLLQKLFSQQQEKIVVYDPHERLTDMRHREVCFTEQQLISIPENVFYIDISHEEINIGVTANDFSIELNYINNPDGTMRWIFLPKGNSPSYLSLYNSGGMKARLYKKLTQLAWTIGQGKLLVSGKIRLQQKLFQNVKQHYGIHPEEEISFFTGTRGENRKVVMEIHHDSVTTHFLKIPMNETSEQLIKNENEMLNDLSKYDFTTLSFPSVSQKGKGYARLSNIKPAVTIPADRITAIHIRTQAELYALSNEKKTIADTAAWNTISANMELLKRDMLFTNGLDQEEIRHVIHLLRKLYNALPTEELIPVSVSHGDFTPWNMYCDEQRLYVYDWELAKNGIPMFFDVFHFTFQTTILRQHKDFPVIQKAIATWTKTPLVQQLVHKYKINLNLHLRLYLLFTVSYYLRQYIGEEELLEQSKWMLNVWVQALETLTQTADNNSSRA